MLVIISGYHSILGHVLYVTCVPIGKMLMTACTCFSLVGHTASACGLALAAFPNYILAACDIGRSDLACLSHNSSMQYSYMKSGQNGDCWLSPWLWTTIFSQAVHIFLLVHWIDGNVISLCCGAHPYLP